MTESLEPQFQWAGLPMMLVSDKGSEINIDGLKKLIDTLGIEIDTDHPYKKRTDRE